MGTRADFYIGRGKTAEWVGSIAYDGHDDGIDKELLQATTKEGFLKELNNFFKDRDDVTLPKDGWPWPWEDSLVTDYSYALDEGKVWATNFGHGWYDPIEALKDRANLKRLERPEFEARYDAERKRIEVKYGTETKTSEFPKMKSKQNITFGQRSGIMIFGK